jgi:hypothetical protein
MKSVQRRSYVPMLHLPLDVVQWNIAPYLSPSDKVAFNCVTGDAVYARIPKKKLDEMEWLINYTFLKKSLWRVICNIERGVSRRVRRKNWSRFYRMFHRYATVFRYHTDARRLYLEKLESAYKKRLEAVAVEFTDIRTPEFIQNMRNVYTYVKDKMDTEYAYTGVDRIQQTNGNLPSFQ